MVVTVKLHLLSRKFALRAINPLSVGFGRPRLDHAAAYLPLDKSLRRKLRILSYRSTRGSAPSNEGMMKVGCRW